MGHGYVKSQYGCNCFYNDSSYKRYNRAHLGGDTLIFNYNYGCQGNCSGGCGMGFWGGFGMGLGGFFGNLLGGFMGGGFGNMWGGFSPFTSFWGGGGGGSPRVSDYVDYSSRRSRRSSSAKSDIDNPKIADFTTKINDLTKDNIGTEYNRLKAEIEKAKQDTDNLNKTADEQTYDNLLQMLDKAKKALESDGSAIIGDQSSSNFTVIIKGKPINGLEDLNTVNLTDIKALDKDTARAALIKLGYMNDDAGSHIINNNNDATRNSAVGKFTANPKIVALQEAAKIDTEVEKYTGTNNNKDYYVTGLITLDNQAGEDGYVTENGSQYLVYTVNCQNTGAEGYKYTYKLKIPKDIKNDETFPVIKTSPNGTQVTEIWTYKGEKTFAENTSTNPTVRN